MPPRASRAYCVRTRHFTTQAFASPRNALSRFVAVVAALPPHAPLFVASSSAAARPVTTLQPWGSEPATSWSWACSCMHQRLQPHVGSTRVLCRAPRLTPDARRQACVARRRRQPRRRPRRPRHRCRDRCRCRGRRGGGPSRFLRRRVGGRSAALAAQPTYALPHELSYAPPHHSAPTASSRHVASPPPDYHSPSQGGPEPVRAPHRQRGLVFLGRGRGK